MQNNLAKSTTKPIKRGSRSWFTSKLSKIKENGGDYTRELAAREWGKNVHGRLENAGYEGADVVDKIEKNAIKINTLHEATKKIKDFAAKNKIEKILDFGIQKIIKTGSDSEIDRIAALLEKENIKNAIRFQSVSEDSIRRAANEFCTPDNKKSVLKIRRKFRKSAKQATAELNMSLNLIGKNGYKHCTNYEIELRNQQKSKHRKFGEETILKRDETEIELIEVMKNSNRNRMAEILALTSGIEKFAAKKGMNWAFITLTCPPNMHSNPKFGTNKWDGTLPDAAHDWLKEKYKKVDARLRKKGIYISGLRVVEPHADGCPHWHLLIFALPKNMAKIEAEFRHSKNQEWKSDAGCKFVIGDGRTKATSYIFKYVIKTIGSVEKLEGELASVDSWRSTWAIRSFQFFGLPPVGLWRRLRSVKNQPLDSNLAEIWQAANAGDGEKFIELAGGLAVKNSTRPIYSKTENPADSFIKIISFYNRETGELSEFPIKKFEFISKVEIENEIKKVEKFEQNQQVTIFENDNKEDFQFCAFLPSIQKIESTAKKFEIDLQKISFLTEIKNRGELQKFKPAKFIQKFKFETGETKTDFLIEAGFIRSNKKVEVIHNCPSRSKNLNLDADFEFGYAGKPNPPPKRPPLGCYPNPCHHGKKKYRYRIFKIPAATFLFPKRQGFGVLASAARSERSDEQNLKRSERCSEYTFG